MGQSYPAELWLEGVGGGGRSKREPGNAVGAAVRNGDVCDDTFRHGPMTHSSSSGNNGVELEGVGGCGGVGLPLDPTVALGCPHAVLAGGGDQLVILSAPP